MSRRLRVCICVVAHALVLVAALYAIHPAPWPLVVALVVVMALVSRLAVDAFVPEVRE